jgi:hypothetical protein
VERPERFHGLQDHQRERALPDVDFPHVPSGKAILEDGAEKCQVGSEKC